MNENKLEQDMGELSSAEDFLDYFAIDYDPCVVQVNRLHILQRFHDYIGETNWPDDESERRDLYTGLLRGAYQDFVASSALTEKVFRVFRKTEATFVSIPLANIGRQG